MDDSVTKILLEITSQLGKIQGSLSSFVDRIEGVEGRINTLEGRHQESFKDQIIQYTLKALIATLAIVASLTGAGSLLKGIFGQ